MLLLLLLSEWYSGREEKTDKKVDSIWCSLATIRAALSIQSPKWLIYFFKKPMEWKSAAVRSFILPTTRWRKTFQVQGCWLVPQVFLSSQHRIAPTRVWALTFPFFFSLSLKVFLSFFHLGISFSLHKTTLTQIIARRIAQQPPQTGELTEWVLFHSRMFL